MDVDDYPADKDANAIPKAEEDALKRDWIPRPPGVILLVTLMQWIEDFVCEEEHHDEAEACHDLHKYKSCPVGEHWGLHRQTSHVSHQNVGNDGSKSWRDEP